MDEEEFDAAGKLRPFGTADAMRLFAQDRADTALVMKLGTALWGTTSEEVQRQLSAPHPEIPSGFELADFRKLLRITVRWSSAMAKVRGLPSPRGTNGFSLWESRCEVVRRAIDYLEKG